MRSRSEETRIAIIDAASKLFMQNGYASTSLDSVAMSVGVTRKTVYNYFNSKGSLFESVIDKTISSGCEPPSDATIETVDDLNRELYLVVESINSVLLSRQYIEFLRMAISEVKFQPDVQVMMKKALRSGFLNKYTIFYLWQLKNESLVFRT